jgi:ADP-glucose pyrophosphorylase
MVSFAGGFRVIDFSLINCVCSGLRRVHVLAQYRSQGLERHLARRWGFTTGLGAVLSVLPPRRSSAGIGRYDSTGAAVLHNLDLVESARPAVAMVLSGDHVYLADPRWPAGSPFWDWLPLRRAAAAWIDGDRVGGVNVVARSAQVDSDDVVDCVISPRARVHSGARLERCILLPGAVVARGAQLRRVIVDEDASVLPGARWGLDGDVGGHPRSPKGVTVVARARRGRAPRRSSMPAVLIANRR